MILRSRCHQRRGTHAVEFALVAPLLFGILLAQMIGALAVFTYIETSSLAREGARWACVHGWQYQQDYNKSQTLATDVYTNAIAPKLILMNGASVSYTVTDALGNSWNASNAQQMQTYYDSTSSTYKENTVTVKVSYPFTFFAGVWRPGTVTLTSYSTVSIQY